MQGIIGLPNAGKSTFYPPPARQSPKIADYPFTTLHPEPRGGQGRRYGLCPCGHSRFDRGGARRPRPGDQFLGHVERCAVLLHLIDINEDVCAVYDVIRNELSEYGADLDTKPEIIALNKADTLPPDEAKEKQDALAQHTRVQDIHLISGVARTGECKTYSMP